MAAKFYTGVDLQNQRGINFADPSAATDAVTKQYVDGKVQGLAWKEPVRAATTADIELTGEQTIDGVSVVAGNRVLVMANSPATENGIYVAAAGAWARAADADTGADLLNATVTVSEGTVNGDKVFTQTANAPITVGSTSIQFVPVGGSGQAYTAGNGLSLAGAEFSVLANGTSLDVSSSGVKIADAAAGAGLTSTSGVLAVGAGTGVSVGTDTVGIDTAVVVRKYAAAIGNGTLTDLAVTHNLGTRDITFVIYNASTYEVVYTDAVITDANTLTLTFATAPTSGQFRVVVHA